MCTSDGNHIIIRFFLDDFLRYSGLDKFNIKNKLKKVNSKEEITNYISLCIVMNFNSIEKTYVSNSCKIFLNIDQLDLGIVHSIIELEDKLYMVLKTGRSRPILELEKKLL